MGLQPTVEPFVDMCMHNISFSLPKSRQNPSNAEYLEIANDFEGLWGPLRMRSSWPKACLPNNPPILVLVKWSHGGNSKVGECKTEIKFDIPIPHLWRPQV